MGLSDIALCLRSLDDPGPVTAAERQLSGRNHLQELPKITQRM